MTLLIYSYKAALNDGVELQYSLRSITQNLWMPDLELLIVGDRPPSWCKPNYWTAGNPTDDKISNMAFNIRRAAELVVEQDLYSGSTWYLSDDYFLLDPVDSIVDTHQGLLLEHVKKCQRDLRPGHWYRDAIANTYRELEGERQLLLSYEMHRPMSIQPHEALDALDRIPDGVFWRTWYGNLSEKWAYPARDGRYVGKTFPMGVPWVSSEDRIWAEWLGKKIAAMFPAKSRWEV